MALQLGQHRLMLRPRESRDIRVLSSDLRLSDDATLRWSQDVSGNAVAIASFDQPADHLVIQCSSRVEIGAVAYPVFDIAASAVSFPFRYSDSEWADLGA